MLRRILFFGAIAGVIAGAPMLVMTAISGGKTLYEGGVYLGYATMLVALSTVFVAIKRRRDVEGGGVIRFWPAVGLGLGISLVASLFYAAAWELTQAMSQVDFSTVYADNLLADLKAKGAPPEKIASTAAEMARWAELYKNPLIRIPMTMSEILPVGVLVTFVSAALLRNSRFLPARQAAA
ncbi:DUF4199 domain-containing protein [Caulobacter sp. NIBR1757]|uniref:DUF4199 domain-containing protein n=1 Tax=Caulobacter sp. NIBR1757 TaxID=3016000 RepID=UPI0022F12F9B|nr:DUF4199 domain-containing protein [Caulobacter sp. NIBR1757]WGM37539.1 hypothetical protein AMEJIAPC_00438 [Caulobacter sp. NIBR1757]